MHPAICRPRRFRLASAPWSMGSRGLFLTCAHRRQPAVGLHDSDRACGNRCIAFRKPLFLESHLPDTADWVASTVLAQATIRAVSSVTAHAATITAGLLILGFLFAQANEESTTARGPRFGMYLTSVTPRTLLQFSGGDDHRSGARQPCPARAGETPSRSRCGTRRCLPPSARPDGCGR